MAFGIPVTDFLALCFITARYNPDIAIDDLIIRWNTYEKNSSRTFCYDATNFQDYIFLFATRLGYITYSDWDKIWDKIFSTPKQESKFSTITLRQWIAGMLSFTWASSTDHEDNVFTQKMAEKDQIYSERYCREQYLRENTKGNIILGARFDQRFRELLSHPETLTSEVIINFFISDDYAQRILKLWTRDR